MLFHVSIHFFTLNLLSLLQKLKLSHEHQGFTFEPGVTKAADLLVEHSGGKVSKALKMAIEQNDIIQINNEFAPADYAIETSEDSKVVGSGTNCTVSPFLKKFTHSLRLPSFELHAMGLSAAIQRSNPRLQSFSFAPLLPAEFDSGSIHRSPGTRSSSPIVASPRRDD